MSEFCIYGNRRRPKSVIAGEVKHHSNRKGKKLLNITYMQSVREGKGFVAKLLYTLINKENFDAVGIRPATEGSKAFVKNIAPVLKEANIGLEIHDPDAILKGIKSEMA